MLCGDSVRQFSNMLPSFLNLNALPVPMLSQVYSDPSGLRFSHVLIDIFSKITESLLSGLTFSHVFIDIVLSEECYS